MCVCLHKCVCVCLFFKSVWSWSLERKGGLSEKMMLLGLEIRTEKWQFFEKTRMLSKVLWGQRCSWKLLRSVSSSSAWPVKAAQDSVLEWVTPGDSKMLSFTSSALPALARSGWASREHAVFIGDHVSGNWTPEISHQCSAMSKTLLGKGLMFGLN